MTLTNPRTDIAWRQRAACRDLPTELFFPAGELEDQAVEQAEEAKAVCMQCPVRTACLEFALLTNQPYGIWGGANASERRSIRRRRQAERRRQASCATSAVATRVSPPSRRRHGRR